MKRIEMAAFWIAASFWKNRCFMSVCFGERRMQFRQRCRKCQLL